MSTGSGLTENERRTADMSVPPHCPYGEEKVAIRRELMAYDLDSQGQSENVAAIKHPQVLAFARAMDAVLTKNDYKGGWRDCKLNYLRFRLVGELGEYFALVSEGETRGEPYKKELVDIANFAMMLWDRS